jgi:hypothetical protein
VRGAGDGAGGVEAVEAAGGFDRGLPWRHARGDIREIRFVLFGREFWSSFAESHSLDFPRGAIFSKGADRASTSDAVLMEDSSTRISRRAGGFSGGFRVRLAEMSIRALELRFRAGHDSECC